MTTWPIDCCAAGVALILFGSACFGCGIRPEDVAGTWIFDEGSTVTLDCEKDDYDSVYNMTGQTVIFEEGSGTPYDIVYSVAPGCDLGYDIEGSDLVLMTTNLEGCYTDPASSAFLSDDFRMTLDGDRILLGGSPTVTVQSPDDPEGFTCQATISGSLSRQESEEEA